MAEEAPGRDDVPGDLIRPGIPDRFLDLSGLVAVLGANLCSEVDAHGRPPAIWRPPDLPHSECQPTAAARRGRRPGRPPRRGTTRARAAPVSRPRPGSRRL